MKAKIAIHSNMNVRVHLGAGSIGHRVYGIIYTLADDEGPHIWPDHV